MDVTKKKLLFINEDTCIFLNDDRICFRNNKGYFDIELTKAKEVYQFICKRKIDLCEVIKIQNGTFGKELLAVLRLLVERRFAYYSSVYNDIFFISDDSYHCLDGGWNYDITLDGKNKQFAFIYNIKEDFEFHKFYAVYLIFNKISSYLIIRINNYEEYKSYSKGNANAHIGLNAKKIIFNTIIYLRNQKEYLDTKCLELEMDLTEVHIINKPIIDYADNLLDFFETIKKFDFTEIKLQREDINQTILSNWKLYFPKKNLLIGGESHMIALENAVITLFEEAYLDQIEKNETIICTVINTPQKKDKTNMLRCGILKHIYEHSFKDDVCFRDISICFNKNSKLLFYEEILKSYCGNFQYKFYSIQSNIIVAQLFSYEYSIWGIGNTYENALICVYKKAIFSFTNYMLQENKIYSWMLEESKIDEIDIWEVNRYYFECICKTEFYEIYKIGRT